MENRSFPRCDRAFARECPSTVTRFAGLTRGRAFPGLCPTETLRLKMTAPELAPQIPAPTPTSWDQEFANLKARFPRAKDSIVFCLHALQQSANIAIDDLRAQAMMHGIRVTASSLTAAQRLLNPAQVTSSPRTKASVPQVPSALQQPRTRTVRVADSPVDAETMIRQMIGKLQSQNTAESARLRDAIRKAIAVLQSALGS